MSFHEDFIAALLPDIRTALTLDAASVYAGARRQRVKSSEGEVWVESVGAPPLSGNLGSRMVAHDYIVHVRDVELSEGSGTAAIRAARARGRVETLRLRYQGERPFSVAIGDLVAIEVDERPIQLVDSILDAPLGLRVAER